MDPITATIVAGVLWFVLGPIAAVILFWVVAGIGLLIYALTDQKVWTVIFGFSAWIAAVGFEIFVLVQVVIHIVHLVQLIQH